VNVGYVANVRALLQQARGQYVAILCADDWWEQDFLAQTLALCREDPRVSFVHTGFCVQEEPSQRRRPHVMADCPRLMEGRAFLDRYFFGGGMFLALSSVVFRRDLALAAHAYAQDVFHADTALWLQLAWLGRVGYCATPLATYRWHPANLSHQTARAQRLIEWLDALEELLAFAREQGNAVALSWERAVLARTLHWCLKDAPNVKIASGSNREVLRLVSRVSRMQPQALLHPVALARVLGAVAGSPQLLGRLKRWRRSWKTSQPWDGLVEQVESIA